LEGKPLLSASLARFAVVAGLPGSRLNVFARDLLEPAVESVPQLLRLVVALGPAPAGDDYAGGRHPTKTSEPDHLPWHAHQSVGYGP
jgi:hypothetical protein